VSSLVNLRGSLTLLIAASALAGCENEVPQSSTEAPLPVEVARSRGDADDAAIVAVGTVARQREPEVSFRLPGTLTHLAVDAGDVVQRGQILAELDPTETAARLASASAESERARRTLLRYESLASSGAIARSLYEDQRTVVDQMDAAQATAAFDRRSSALASPVSGLVLQRVAQTGETVSAGQAVLRLADLGSPLLIRVPLVSTDAARVRIGAPASARFELTSSDIPGRVTRVGRLASGTTGTRDIEVTLNAARHVESGMVGRVTIKAGAPNRRGGVRIPSEALVPRPDGGSAVFVLSGKRSRARFHSVGLLRLDGDDAIVSGLPAGISVITAGAGYVKDRQVVLVSRLAP